jgi:uncharacterized damage-inducible protein DinB
MNDRVMRCALVELLRGGSAHVDARRVLEGIPRSAREKAPETGATTIWGELEHMRIAQEDIIRYTLDQAWVSPEWPEGYWPSEMPADEGAWDRSVEGFFRDLDDVVSLVEDESVDLTAEIPHGEGRTYLRQALLVADHNAYHLGQIVLLRKLLGVWESTGE